MPPRVKPQPPDPSGSRYGTGPQAPDSGEESTPGQPQVHAGAVWVSRVFPQGEQFNEQNLEARIFATQPATVTAKLGRTINLGNYENVKIEVGVSLPCYAEEVQNGLEAVAEMCSKFVADEEAAVRAVMNKRKNAA